MGFLKDKVTISRVVPRYAVPGGRVTIMGHGLDGRLGNSSDILLNGVPSHVTCATNKTLVVIVPDGLSGQVTNMTLGDDNYSIPEFEVAHVLAAGIHAVDSPVVDRQGNVYTTLSGTRGEKSPVSVFRIKPDGAIDTDVTDIMNATSLAFGPDEALYVSSRFNGTIYRISAPGDVSVYAEGLGTATGIAFDPKGNLVVGDRTGTLFVVAPDRTVEPLLNIPPSVAAFHLCFGPDGSLYITNPDISTYDSILRVPQGSTEVQEFYPGIKRPQGMAFDVNGNLYVAKAMAGDSGVLRISPDGKASMIVSGPVLVGVVFDTAGDIIVAGTEMRYRLEVGVHGMPPALTSVISTPKIK